MNAVPELYQRHRLSVENYHRMGEAGIFAPDARVELINGEIIEMTPIGPMHLGITDQLARILFLELRDRAIVRVQGSVVLEDFSEPEPDVVLLRPRDDFYKHRAAGPSDVLLLIEVSDTSLRYDTQVKQPLYAQTGIPEFWVVDIQAKCVRRFARPEHGRWQWEEILDDLSAVQIDLVPDLSLDLRGLF